MTYYGVSENEAAWLSAVNKYVAENKSISFNDLYDALNQWSNLAGLDEEFDYDVSLIYRHDAATGADTESAESLVMNFVNRIFAPMNEILKEQDVVKNEMRPPFREGEKRTCRLLECKKSRSITAIHA